jgi:hypothetical protein
LSEENEEMRGIDAMSGIDATGKEMRGIDVLSSLKESRRVKKRETHDQRSHVGV